MALKKTGAVALVCLCLCSCREIDTTTNQPVSENPLGISATQQGIQTRGIPTVTTVADLEQRAWAAFGQNDCANAIPLLEDYTDRANSLANLIMAGQEPFYSASETEQNNFEYRAKNAFPYKSPIPPYQTLANEYKGKRNQAMVMRAECQIKLERKEEAAALLIEALKLIEIEDSEWWSRARKSLYGLIGVRPSMEANTLTPIPPTGTEKAH